MKRQNGPNWVEIATLVVIVLGGIFQFAFFGVLKRSETKANIEMISLQKQLTEIEREFKSQKEILSVKSSEASLKNTELGIFLSELEVSMKEIKENLSIFEKRVSLSSGIQNILYNIKPSVYANIMKEQNSKYENGRLELYFFVENKGAYPVDIKNSKIIVSKHKIPINESISEFNSEYIGISGSIPPGSMIPFTIAINNVPKTIPVVYLRAIFQLSHNQKIVKIITKYSENVISSNELLELSKTDLTLNVTTRMMNDFNSIILSPIEIE